jgi:hypothetical protein
MPVGGLPLATLQGAEPIFTQPRSLGQFFLGETSRQPVLPEQLPKGRLR